MISYSRLVSLSTHAHTYTELSQTFVNFLPSSEQVLVPPCSHQCPSWLWALSVAAAASSTNHRSRSTLAITMTTATEKRSHISKMRTMKTTVAWWVHSCLMSDCHCIYNMCDSVSCPSDTNAEHSAFREVESGCKSLGKAAGRG